MTIEIQPSKAFSSELVSHLNRSVLSYDPVSDPIQWREGERLEHLLEERCRAFQQAGKSDHVALSFRDQSLTYEELNRRSNQLAHFLKRRGIQPGDRVGHLFQKTPETYVALFAALKAGATFLPLDVTIPEERLKFIIQDSELKALLTMSAFESQFGGLELETLYVDTLGDELSKEPEVSLYQSLPQEDSIAYIIYTSGTTGNPKGVAIQHSSICNFVRVAATAYGYREDDRVYQGMTLSFDFSFEEVFVPLMAGSTLVPSPGGLMLGAEKKEKNEYQCTVNKEAR